VRIPLVDLRIQYKGIEGEVLAEIAKALDSMNLFLGHNVQQFETDFARYCGTEFAIGVGSGTEALHLALLACGIKQDDEVITVSNTFIATVEAIALVGAKPVFVDIEYQTYNIDPHQIENKITNMTKAVLPVHLYGHPAKMDIILDLAKAHKLKVIEDACQAHGAKYLGRHVGSIGDTGCFSFYFTKNLGAYGEAGMIVTSDPDIAKKCKMLRDHGQNVKYYHELLGVNSRLDEIQAAVLRVKLPHLDEWNEKRRRLARAYEVGLPASVVKPIEMPWAKHVYHLYVIRTPVRDQLRVYLADRGIATGMHYPVPIHLQRACQGYCCGAVTLPVTERVVREILSLPIYPELSVEQVEYICRCIRDFAVSQGDAIEPSVRGGAQGG
jgi:dTDP-4-amino-4,6-dideoxygalactose transaminase